MEEIRDIFTVIAQSTQATTSAAEAVKQAVGDKKSSTTDWSRLLAKPNIFDYNSQEEEIKAFREWSTLDTPIPLAPFFLQWMTHRAKPALQVPPCKAGRGSFRLPVAYAAPS